MSESRAQTKLNFEYFLPNTGPNRLNLTFYRYGRRNRPKKEYQKLWNKHVFLGAIVLLQYGHGMLCNVVLKLNFARADHLSLNLSKKDYGLLY